MALFRHFRRSVLGALLALLASGALAEAQEVDLELVLAVDISRSMDPDELALQREGYAAALTHPAVVSAVTRGPLGRIALSYFEWAGPGTYNPILPWRIVEDETDLAEAAAVLRAAPVRSALGTSISGAIDRAVVLLETNEIQAPRQVIDVSGDGPNNTGPLVLAARDRAAALGIEINGLPIMLKEPTGWFSIPDLDLYYQACVVSGEAAFVIPVFERDRLIGAIRQKMVLEIAGLRPPGQPALQPAASFDCMIGEKLRRRWENQF
ncbi:MAG: DUF1194 domain-containing protein [Pseudomonadota bacterium]